MNKQTKYTYSGMRQDISNAKFQNEFYFEGMNIRILSTDKQSSGAVTNTKGNELLLSIPIPVINTINNTITYNSEVLPYTNLEIETLTNSNLPQVIIGNCKTKNGFVIFSTNDSGLDCIWFLDENTLSIKLLYLRDLNFSTQLPIQCINNYENNDIDKIYWVNSEEQVRFLNLNHSIDNDDLEELIDIPSSLLNFVSDVTFSTVNIEDVSYGGSHTSGMIQYAYSYYSINGSESTISPLSNIIPLGKSVVQGGNVNEIVGTIPKVVINNLDSKFSNLKLYAIKYTSLNEIPSINVIADRNVTGLSSFTYYDDGRTLFSLTLEDIIFTYGKIIIPKHIESKNNRLFAFNYKDRVYNLTQKDNNLDTRAYSFPISSANTTVYSSISNYDEITDVITGVSHNINYTTNILNPNFLAFDNASINSNYDLNKYLPNSTTLGGEGYFLKYEVIRTLENANNIYDYRFFKENELYRIGIQFYNKYGLKSTPNWISDFIVTSVLDQDNLSGFYAGIKLTLKPEFYVWLNTSSNFLNDNNVYDDFLKPVGFKLLRADRTNTDKTIISQGIINGMLAVSTDIGYPDDPLVDIERCKVAPKIPSLMRRFDNYLCPMFKNQTFDRLDKKVKGTHPQWKSGFLISPDSSTEVYKPAPSEDWNSSTYQFNQLMQFYSPDVLFNITNNIESNKINVLGGIINNFNSAKYRRENWKDAEFFKFNYLENAISTYDVKSTIKPGEAFKRGIFGPTYIGVDENRKHTTTYQFFREYTGTFIKNQGVVEYDIYGKPEVTETDQGSTKYNNNSDLTYINNLNVLITGTAGNDGNSNTIHTNIDSVVSEGTRCVTFALGDENDDIENRPTIEQLFDGSLIEPLIDESQISSNITIVLDFVYAYVSDLASAVFPGQYVGILENNNIYYNNDKLEPVGTFNSENVDLIFDSIASYDAIATTTMDDWTGLKVAIVDGVTNIIYLIVDQNTSLAGLTDTLDTFDYMDPLPLGSINQYVSTLSALYSIETDTISDGYIVGVIENLNKYEWDATTSTWSVIGTFIAPTSSDYKGGAGLIVEFVNDRKLKYIGNYYGGNSYESKTKTIYVEASNYYTIGTSTTNYTIVDPGDTFVQEYNIMRISKDETLPDSSGLLRVSEIIKVRLESLVNQNKRNDESRFEWRQPWQASQGDYHTYNRVYSQQSNLLKSQDISFEVKNNELFDASIISSNFKRPGEIIDNWTKFSINDTLDLEGKYGSINGVVKHNDEIFTFQDTAVAQISINPRVQIQGDDGIEIKLGTGNLLDGYNYLNTNSGTLNKWGIISTNVGIFYYDTINNSLNVVQNNKISDLKYLHSFFQKNINNNIVKLDNHILKNGIQFGYDSLNNDVYFTFLQGNDSKTINFNELQNEFVSLHSFKPSFYFNKGNIFITTNSLNTTLYNHLEGIYNIYYGVYEPSYVILNLNPEPDVECIYDNISFESELYLNDVDQYDKTITNIQCYNEYQDSGLISLVNSRIGNLRRKFRTWNAFIPREDRNRIRGPYSKLKLQFNNQSNYKLILHDIILSYTI